MTIQEDLRRAAGKLRGSSMPLSDLIPLLQRAADDFDRRELVVSAQKVQVMGSTVYELNQDGVNRWWANVQPGRDDDSQGVTGDECRYIAVTIANHLNNPTARWQPYRPNAVPDMELFVAKAVGVPGMGSAPYTSDPWCVWHMGGKLSRWPHRFQPTHMLLLPPIGVPT